MSSCQNHISQVPLLLAIACSCFGVGACGSEKQSTTRTERQTETWSQQSSWLIDARNSPALKNSEGMALGMELLQSAKTEGDFSVAIQQMEAATAAAFSALEKVEAILLGMEKTDHPWAPAMRAEVNVSRRAFEATRNFISSFKWRNEELVYPSPELATDMMDALELVHQAVIQTQSAVSRYRIPRYDGG